MINNKFISFLFCFFISFSKLNASNYFIDYVNGNDNNDGLSINTPFKHCPGDTAAKNNSNIILKPGDIVIFKGGTTYTIENGKYIEVNASGSFNNVITYISGERFIPNWGNSPAVINASNSSLSPNFGAVYIPARQWIIWNGISIKNGISGGWWAAHIGGDGLWKNIIIMNSEFGPGYSAGIYFRGSYDSSGPYPGNLTVNNCHIHDLTDGHGIFVQWGMTNLVFSNNLIHDIGATGGDDPIGLFGVGGGATGEQIDVLIKNNELYNVPIKSHIILSSSSKNVIIENNYLHGIVGFSSIDINGPTLNLIIRNNLFDCTIQNFFAALSFSTDKGSESFCNGIKIYNNTFNVNISRELGLEDSIIYFSPGNSPHKPNFKNIDIKNNIIQASANNKTMIYVGRDSSGNPIVEPSSFVCDYNIYNWLNSNAQFAWNGNGMDFITWKSSINKDIHSKNGIVSFVSNQDFHLNNNDILAKGNGIDLSNTGFNKDKDNKIRTNPWDVGAYVANSTLTIPPTEPLPNVIQPSTNSISLAPSITNITYFITSSDLGNILPTVIFLSPLNNQTYPPKSNIIISLQATDLDGTISQIQIYLNNTLIATSTNSSFTFTNFNTEYGHYNLLAKTTDNNGGISTNSINITINPNIKINWEFSDPKYLVTNYNVYKSVGNGNFNLLTNTPNNFIIDLNINTGEYRYKITALNNFGENAPSLEKLVIIP